jgi:hypothetical protein
MAKKLGKLAFVSLVAGAAAGTYYYLQNKNKKSEEVVDDIDDIDDFDDDLEDEDFSSEPQSHSRVTIDLIDLDNAKEKIGEKVIETLDKAKEFIGDRISSSNDSEPEYTEMDFKSGQASTPDDAATEDLAEDLVSEDLAKAPKEDEDIEG